VQTVFAVHTGSNPSKLCILYKQHVFYYLYFAINDALIFLKLGILTILLSNYFDVFLYHKLYKK